MDDEKLIEGILQRVRRPASLPGLVEHDFALAIIAPNAKFLVRDRTTLRRPESEDPFALFIIEAPDRSRIKDKLAGDSAPNPRRLTRS